MKVTFASLFCLILMLSACDNDNTSSPLPTSSSTAPVASATPESPPPTPTLPPQSPDWDSNAVWQDYYDSTVFDCLPRQDTLACVLEVAESAAVGQPVIDFIEANQAALVSFEELGPVDYGEVSWPAFNMGREEPVLLNGDFGLVYYGMLVPEDWRTAHPSYEFIEVDASGLGPYPWAEYSGLAESSSGPEGQRLVFETVIQTCRACQPVGFLALELNYTPEGEQESIEVLPLRCRPESEVFVDLSVGEGPCSED